MKKIIFILSISCILFITSCKDDNAVTPTKKDYKTFVNNTEWVGVLSGSGSQYPRPCSLKFNDDNTFTIYALFIFPNEVKDSITADIKSIDSLADGRIRINTSIITSYSSIVTEALYITDRHQLVGVSEVPVQQPTFQLELYPNKAVSVNGEWSGLARTSPGTGYDYPDVSSIKFVASEGATYYFRNGQTVIWVAPNTFLSTIYKQNGPRVYMSGFNDYFGQPDLRALIPYFGVLLPSGDKMMVDSRHKDSRLPNYIYTDQPYGPNGATPIISKK